MSATNQSVTPARPLTAPAPNAVAAPTDAATNATAPGAAAPNVSSISTVSPSTGGASALPAVSALPVIDLANASVTEILQHQLGRAAADGTRVDIWVLRFDGLSKLGDAAASTRARLAASVRLGLRSVDLVRWTGEEEMTIVTQGSDPEGSPLAERFEQLVRPHLSRAAPSSGPITMRAGRSTFPSDAHDVRGLLDAAAARLR
jgi:hypothetical protein